MKTKVLFLVVCMFILSLVSTYSPALASSTNVASTQVYNTTRIRLKAWIPDKNGVPVPQKITSVRICGYDTQWKSVCAVSNPNSNIYDLRWWLRANQTIAIYLTMEKYYTPQSCAIRINPPYKDGWITVTYVGNGKCNVTQGQK